MAPPVPPYATTAQVATLLTNHLNGATDYTEEDRPTKTQVTSILTWISAQVDLSFQAAGYKLPLAVIEGETWLASQTYYLALVTAMGAAAQAGSHVLKPAPALGPGRPGSTGNIFQDMFRAELRNIFNEQFRVTAVRFRADFYLGTAAEKAVSEPSGPTTDYMQGRYDPMQHLNMYDMTEKVHQIQEALRDANIIWDYMYTFAGLNQGLGQPLQEGIGSGV